MDSTLDQFPRNAENNYKLIVLSTLRTEDNGVEDCVSSHKGDWGRKCHVERQALSDCSEEKYHPCFIPCFMLWYLGFRGFGWFLVWLFGGEGCCEIGMAV